MFALLNICWKTMFGNKHWRLQLFHTRAPIFHRVFSRFPTFCFSHNIWRKCCHKCEVQRSKIIPQKLKICFLGGAHLGPPSTPLSTVHTLVHRPYIGSPSKPRQNFKLVEKRNQKHDPEIISDTWTWADAMYGQILLTNESHKKYCRLIQKAKDLRCTCILLHIINIIIMKLHCCTDRSLRAAINKYKHFDGRNSGDTFLTCVKLLDPELPCYWGAWQWCSAGFMVWGV